MDEGARLILQPGRDLFDDDQTEVFDQRHHHGEVELPRRPVDRDPREVVGRCGRLRARRLVLEAHHDLRTAVDQRLQVEDVAGCYLEAGRRLVVLGEESGPALAKPLRIVFRDAAGELLDDPVLPVPRKAEHGSLEVRNVDVERGVLVDPDREVDASIPRLAEGEAVVDRMTAECHEEQLLERLAKVGVEAVPRNGDQDRDKPFEAVSADEESDGLPLLGLHQVTEHLAERIHGHGEEVVLGERLEELDDGLVVMRALDDVLTLDHLPELPPEHRDLRRRRHVGLGGEQPEEPELGDHRSLVVHAPEPDVVHPGVSMNRGVTIGLRDHHQLGAEIALPEVLWEVVQGDGRWFGAVLRENAEPGREISRDRPTRVRGLDAVLPIAEEDEVVVEEPLQKCDGLGDVLEVVVVRSVLGGGRHAGDRAAHRLEVAHHSLDVPEDADDDLLEPLRLVCVEDPG